MKNLKIHNKFCQHKMLLLACVIGCVFTSCNNFNPDPFDYPVSTYIFKFADESYKNYILCVLNYDSTRYIPNLKYSPNLKLTDIHKPYPSHVDTFDICELATNEKFIRLHDDYLLYAPYDLRQCNVLLNANWEQICDIDLDTVGIRTIWQNSYAPRLEGYGNIYSELYESDTYWVCSYFGISLNQLTIQHIIDFWNQLIDNNSLFSMGNIVR